MSLFDPREKKIKSAATTYHGWVLDRSVVCVCICGSTSGRLGKRCKSQEDCIGMEGRNEKESERKAREKQMGEIYRLDGV